MSYRELIVGIIIGLGMGAGVSTVLAQDDTNDRPETVIREGLAPTRAAPNDKAQITLYAEGDKAFLGKLRVKPGAKLPEHTDKSEEYLYVLKGKGTLTVSGTDYEIEPHTGVYIPAGAKVTYKNGDGVLEAVQFFAPADSANKYTDWKTGQVPMKTESEKEKKKGEKSGDQPKMR